MEFRGYTYFKKFTLFLQDFDILGARLVSCGMDHSLKIWWIETEKIKKVCICTWNYLATTLCIISCIINCINQFKVTQTNPSAGS